MLLQNLLMILPYSEIRQVACAERPMYVAFGTFPVFNKVYLFFFERERERNGS
jgi:hypothetical protein